VFPFSRVYKEGGRAGQQMPDAAGLRLGVFVRSFAGSSVRLRWVMCPISNFTYIFMYAPALILWPRYKKWHLVNLFSTLSPFTDVTACPVAWNFNPCFEI
jgi:hypothetical protein